MENISHDDTQNSTSSVDIDNQNRENDEKINSYPSNISEGLWIGYCCAGFLFIGLGFLLYFYVIYYISVLTIPIVIISIILYKKKISQKKRHIQRYYLLIQALWFLIWSLLFGITTIIDYKIGYWTNRYDLGITIAIDIIYGMACFVILIFTSHSKQQKNTPQMNPSNGNIENSNHPKSSYKDQQDNVEDQQESKQNITSDVVNDPIDIENHADIPVMTQNPDTKILFTLDEKYNEMKSMKSLHAYELLQQQVEDLKNLAKQLKDASRRRSWLRKIKLFSEKLRKERSYPIIMKLNEKYDRLKIIEIAELCQEDEQFIQDYLEYLIDKGNLNATLFESSHELVFIRSQPDDKENISKENNKYHLKITTDNLQGIIINVENISYKFLKPIGKGGMGIIYLAENMRTKEKIVVKQLLPNRYQIDEYGESNCEKYWAREQSLIRIQSQSPVPNMKCIGALKNENPEAYFLLLEYINGQALDIWLQDRNKMADLTEISFILINIIIPLCEHLKFVHKNKIVHRDITPKNIIIKDLEGSPIPFLIDWGVARELTEEELLPPKKPYITTTRRLTTAIRSIGNPPEVIAGCPPIIMSDIYMVGAVIFYVLTNGTYPSSPIIPEDFILKPNQVNDVIPHNLEKLVEEMTQYEPADRIDSIEKVIDKLHLIIQQLSKEIEQTQTYFPNLPTIIDSSDSTKIIQGNSTKRNEKRKKKQ